MIIAPAAFAAVAAVAALAGPDCPHGVVVNGLQPNAWKRAVASDKSASPTTSPASASARV